MNAIRVGPLSLSSLKQPSNIFETKLFPDGSERYIPISRATWKTCLVHLREQIIEAGLKIAKKSSSPKKTTSK